MKSWCAFADEEPELAAIGKTLLFPSPIGRAFLATIRKDGAPRLHPVSLVLCEERLYILIPWTSPKCGDLLRDGRYALQAFPPPGELTQEFYLSGRAEPILEAERRQALIAETRILAGENEVLFELLLERAMYTTLENWGTPHERPTHRKWRATRT